MIELPEAITIGRQVEQILAGRKVTNVYGATYLHKFTFLMGLPMNTGICWLVKKLGLLSEKAFL